MAQVQPPTAALKDLTLDTEAPLKKVDSAVQGMEPESPKAQKKHGRKPSVDNGVVDIKTLDPESVKFSTEAIESVAWKISTSTNTAVDKEATKKMLTTPPVKSIEFCMPLSERVAGLEFKVVKPKGVTVKDVMDKLSKKYKDKKEEELPFGEGKAFLKGFEWNHHFDKFQVVLDTEQSVGGIVSTGKKGKKKKGGD